MSREERRGEEYLISSSIYRLRIQEFENFGTECFVASPSESLNLRFARDAIGSSLLAELAESGREI